MNKQHILFLSCSFLIFFVSSCSTPKQAASRPDTSLRGTLAQRFKHASSQYKLLMEDLPAGRLPKTYVKNSNYLETSGPDWWTSGFYTGTLFYLYEETGDSTLLMEGRRSMKLLDEEKNNGQLADLGAILYNSYGTAMKVDPQPAYPTTLLAAAKSLAKRYHPKVKAIRSWDTRQNQKELIVSIDHIMNLELLFWATHASGDSSYYRIAVNQAETIWKHHVRPDYSVCQLVTFDPKTGKEIGKRNAQGYSDSSTWARGEAWALYGYTVLYRETRNQRYLGYAEHLAQYVLDHPNLPKDKIPYWDFNAPEIPQTYRDASAGAILASALLELSGYSAVNGRKYFKAGETMLNTLASPEYTALLGANGGFILEHGAGYIPVMAEIDVPLTYADYYYIQALKRYKILSGLDLHLNAGFRFP